MPAPRTDGAGGGYQVDPVQPGGTDFRLLDITQIYPLVMLEDTAGMRDAAVAWQNLGGRLDAEARALRGSLTGLAGSWRSAAATELGERGEAAATSLDRWSAIAADRAGELFDLAVVVAGRKLRMQWIWDDFAHATADLLTADAQPVPTGDAEQDALARAAAAAVDRSRLDDNLEHFTLRALDEVVNPLANRFAESALLFAAPGPVFAGPTDAAVPGDALLAAIVTGTWLPEGVSFPGSAPAPAVPARPAPPVAPAAPGPPALPPDLAPALATGIHAVPASAVLPVPAPGLPLLRAAALPPVPAVDLQPVLAPGLPPVPDRALRPIPAEALPAAPASVLAPVRVDPSVVAPALPAIPASAAARASLPVPPRVPELGRLPIPPTPGVPSPAAGQVGDPAPRAGGRGGTPTLAGRGTPGDPGPHSPSAIHPPTGSGRPLRGRHPGATAAEPGSPSSRTTVPPQLPGRTRPAAQAPGRTQPRPGSPAGDLLGRIAPARTTTPVPPAAPGSHRGPRSNRTSQPGATIAAGRPRHDPAVPAALRPGRGTAPAPRQAPSQPLLGAVGRPAGGSLTPSAQVATPSRVTSPSPAEERATDRARRRAGWTGARRHQEAAERVPG